MAYSLITSVVARTTNGDTVATSAIDTTGATLLVVGLSYRPAFFIQIADNKSNTLTGVINQNGAAPASFIGIFENPTVGSGHIFSTSGDANSFPSISVLAFSGNAASPATDDTSSFFNNPAATSIQPGSVVPTTDNQLIVTHGAFNAVTDANPPTIDSGFTIQHFTGGLAEAYGLAIAYKILVGSGAQNPTWTHINDLSVATIATFKAASVVGGGGGGEGLYHQVMGTLHGISIGGGKVQMGG